MKRLCALAFLGLIAAGCCSPNLRLGTGSGHFRPNDAEQEAIVYAGTAWTTRTQVTDAVAIAVAESSLFIAARHWYYTAPFRSDGSDCCNTDQLDPLDTTQPCARTTPITCAADRGLWQINSAVWGANAKACATDDTQADDPTQAAGHAHCIYGIQGFNAWSAWSSGNAAKFIPSGSTFLGWPSVTDQVTIYCNAHPDSAAWCNA